jgi:hypothetical protein
VPAFSLTNEFHCNVNGQSYRSLLDNFPNRPGPPVAKSSRDHTPLGGFVRGRAPDQPVLPMAASEKEPKRMLTLSELAEQFRELERLREKVHALEQSASDRTAFGRAGRTAQSDAK